MLLKDISARLPYAVKILDCASGHQGKIFQIDRDVVKIDCYDVDYLVLQTIFNIKPYLRPMSSMTEEEEVDFTLLCEEILSVGKNGDTCILSVGQIDWLNAHHFDYRGLIEKGMALEAPEGMYKI